MKCRMFSAIIVVFVFMVGMQNFAIAEDSMTAKEVQQLEEKATAGDAKAQAMLGLKYAKGEGIKQDYAKAKAYFEQAVKQGNADAQYNLGVMYDEGYGVKQDYKKAKYWFEKSAKQGLVEAQYNLGMMFSEDNGIDKDPIKAMYWFRKAAERANILALQYVINALGQGIGAPQNFSHAYGYLLVLMSIKPHDEADKKIKTYLLSQLSPKQIEEAQSLASKIWKNMEASKSAL